MTHKAVVVALTGDPNSRLSIEEGKSMAHTCTLSAAASEGKGTFTLFVPLRAGCTGLKAGSDLGSKSDQNVRCRRAAASRYTSQYAW